MLTHPLILSDAVGRSSDRAVNTSASAVNTSASAGPAGAVTSADVPTDANGPVLEDALADPVAEPAAEPAVESATAASLVVEERFAIVPEWLLDSDVSDAAIRLYAVLLQSGQSGQSGQSSGRRMPSRRVLAQRLRKKSVDSVDRAMKELVGVGAVVVQHRREGGVNLTNRYVVRSTPPRTRREHALSTSSARSGAGAVSGRGRGTAATAPVGTGREQARCRTGAATGGRIRAVGVAARVRPNPEQLTHSTTPPPRPSAPITRLRTATRRPARPTMGEDPTAVAAELIRLLGPLDLEQVAERCRQLRHDLGLQARLWTAEHLGQVLVTAVRDPLGIGAQSETPTVRGRRLGRRLR